MTFPVDLKRSAVLALGFLLTTSVANAGLVRSMRSAQPIDYVDTVVRSINAYDLQAYWSDSVEELDLASKPEVRVHVGRFYDSRGEERVVTMLQALTWCGNRGCPLRIYSSAGDKLLEARVCEDTSDHALSTDGRVFTACDQSYRIQGDRIARSTPVPVERSKRYWHNGSIVEASYSPDGAVRISYVDPKPDLPAYLRGMTLFEGRFDGSGRLSGTAYTFKSGCVPAPYQVSGTAGPTSMTLAGASPRRDPRSCAVLGYTFNSPNVRLNFIDLAMASR
jgi:hypothetical protein